MPQRVVQVKIVRAQKDRRGAELGSAPRSHRKSDVLRLTYAVSATRNALNHQAL